MKAVIFGEYKVERMVEPLLARGCETIVVYTEEPLDDGVIPDHVIQCRLDLASTPEDIAEVLAAQSPDLATTSIFALGQEQMLDSYAAARELWDGRFVVHGTGFAELASDKVALYRTGLERGWPLPAGAVCASRAEIHATAARLGLPLMIKRGRTQAGDGVHYVATAERLAEISATLTDFPVVVMEFCRGIEVGVELVTGEHSTARWPVESAGQLDADLAPLRRPRVAPSPLPEPAATQLDDLIRDLATAFGPWGGWQLDLAVVGDQLRLLEINGRLGGLSELGLTTTGIDAHEVVIDECLGVDLPSPVPSRVGLEMTGTAGAQLPPTTDGLTLIEITWNSSHRSLKGTDLAQYILGLARYADGEKWVRTMAGRGLRVPVDQALAQLARGCATLGLLP